ncbi:cytochrome c oxidase subunit 6c [Plakobranchus ocellatus]|uniref:Cytochrome c oxidase subunit 6c n=1 Tax=Plakobranchus ocellatus TaxID=259542 RepID=A0AAV4BKL6_9GAST|nr:cytochrome c oxidase subunit 6c [Plakobranchus ocellatus]
MRNLLLNKTKKDFAIALIIASTAAIAYKFGVQERRRSTFQEFYRTYDADKSYERMKKMGVFDSVNKMVEEGHLTK